MQFLATMAIAETADNSLFPRPTELEHDVQFWVRVYTEIDTSSGFIHDSENLVIVYQTLKLGGGSKANKKRIKEVKQDYIVALKRLAAGKRNNLSPREKRVLAMWGEETSNSRFKRAASSLRFQLGQSNQFSSGIIRSGEWSTYIQKVFSDRSLPSELTILPHVESSFNPKAYSSAGAAGLWQFTRPTGRRFMQIDYVVDERMDPFAASIAAAQLLKLNHETTGTWPLALTAYNHGAASMRRATKQLGTTDIATIVRKYKGRAFGFASRNFYVAFLAALQVSQDPEKYFGELRHAKPFDYHRVEMDNYLLVDSFARAFNTNLETLKRHNRSLMAPIWDGTKRVPKGYGMRIPRDQVVGKPESLMASIPSVQLFGEQTPDLFHKVVRGDTVSEIARRYGYNVRKVAAMNGLNKRYQIRIGQTLRLPVSGSASNKAVVVASTLPPNTKPKPASKGTATPTPSTGENVTVAAIKSTATPKLASTKPADIVPAGFTVAQAATSDEELDPGSEAELVTANSNSMQVDPGDYSVAKDKSIEVQAAETLGHYAEWLDLRASRLRQINKIKYGSPIAMGRRIVLDFSRVDRTTFEQRRIAYQKTLQEDFFMAYQIRSTITHVVARGESLWVLSTKKYRVPMWLLRQYNPDLDLSRVSPGTVIKIPELVET
jgi:membrane-bound lytic murein transglycosylase D